MVRVLRGLKSARVENAADRRTWPLACAGLLACALLAGGCAGPKAEVFKDGGDVKRIIAQADQPVLMMFFKGGCASCAALEPTMDKLAEEYKGRAVVGKFMIYTFVFTVTSEDLKDQYDISIVPHVVLTVHGQEKEHWVADYDIDHYRKALNEALASPGVQKVH